jgi:hypothetical protein
MDASREEFLERFFRARLVEGPDFATLVRLASVARPQWVELQTRGPPRKVAAEELGRNTAGISEFNHDFLKSFGESDAANKHAVNK